ncbi:MAG: protein phosphatase 2C family protein [Deltaproteobacteria bacterium]|nr:protein phosphatase 2C family protein [Deltaproteobacteria bacterium]
MKKPEIYGLSKVQEGKKANEDSFVILRGEIPIVAVCDGAGDAEQVAKKVLRSFQALIQNAKPEELLVFPSWKKWVKFLDSNLLGGNQSTFTAIVIIDNRIIGANAGDNRVYKFDKNGSVSILTHGSSKKRLGSGEADPYAIYNIMEKNEIVSVMTDGAWNPLSLSKITGLFRKRLSFHPADLTEKIIEEAGKYGRYDDMTVVNIYF